MANERKTENLVRELLKQNHFFKKNSSIRVEEQTSEIQLVRKCLHKAGKSGNGGKGAPEFTITNDETTDFIIVIECKVSRKDHQSTNLDNPTKYAVDGALHYARHLSQEYNTIAIGISGETVSALKISIYLHVKGAETPIPLTTPEGKALDQIVSWDDFMSHCLRINDVQKVREKDLISFSRNIHDFMRDHAKLTEQEKPLLVSGTLIALQNTAFASSFDKYKPGDLSRRWLEVIEEEL